MTQTRRALAVLLASVAFSMGLGPAPARSQVEVPTKDPAHPRVRYADNLVSLNDRCVVRQGRLNPIFKPVYVNGRPVGFC